MVNNTYNLGAPVSALVTVFVFHNWYVVTVVLLLPFSDFLTLSLIQGLFSWTQETLYKVEGLAVFFSLIFETCLHFVNLYVFNNLFAGNNCVLFPYVKILLTLTALISMWVLIILSGNVMSRIMHNITYLKCANIIVTRSSYNIIMVVVLVQSWVWSWNCRFCMVINL